MKEVGINKIETINVDGEQIERITITSELQGKGGKAVTQTVLYFSNRRIATISEVIQDPETGELVDKVVEKGMTKDEVIKFFPPAYQSRTAGHEFEQLGLVRAIIYEAYRKDNLESGNVRHFWYTHLKPLLIGVMNLTDISSIDSSINGAWKALINSGLVSYEEMNITSGKESFRLSVVKDSPFSNIIIAVEKIDFFEVFSWIPRLFNNTLITAGGHPSRAVIRKFILELKELGVDLNQQFYMCVASDLDPSGYYIQEAFKNQFDLAISHYGGTGTIKIHRLFVRKDQVSNTLLEGQGIPWEPKSTKGESKIRVEKQNETKWAFFCDQTGGGIYIPVPTGWKGKVVEIEDEEKVRAMLEMDAFSNKTIEASIISELLKIIRETSDETKIMIPEIMRIFELLKTEVSEETYQEWKQKLVDPLIQEFLEDTDEWKTEIENKHEEEQDDINNEYKKKKEEKEQEKRDREPELFDQKDNLKDVIDALNRERYDKITKINEEYDDILQSPDANKEDVEDEINEKCEDLDEDIENLETERDDKLEQASSDYDSRMDKYTQFKEEHSTVFNPVEQALKDDVTKKFEELIYYFRDLEQRENIRGHIAGLLDNQDLLLAENTSCFDQPVPTFKGEKFLEQAAESRDLNIGKVRDSFTESFKTAMKNEVRTDTADLEFELTKTVEMKDLTQEIEEAKQKAEDDIE